MSEQSSSAWIVTADISVGSELAAGAASAGVSCIVLAVGDASGNDAITVDSSSREGFKQAYESALNRSGPPGLVLFMLIPAQSLAASPVTSLDSPTWTATAEAPVRSLFHGLQGLLDVFSDTPLSIAVLGPTCGNIGAPGLVALSTALEAQRGIVKSVARQLGARGVTLNWIGVAPEAYSASLADADIPHGPEMGEALYALGRPANLRGEVARAVTLLANPAARPITGATINIDGGEWMLP